MSALAQLMHSKGHNVSGSDIHDSDKLYYLQGRGIRTTVGHFAQNVINAELVVYNAAIDWDNPELAYARETGINAVTRAELLGIIMSEYRYSVAVSGAHGKTTTAAMISSVLKSLDPTVHIGGEAKGLGNLRIGGSSIFVTEACEYAGSFLHLKPVISVVLNIDSDHLDYYKDIDEIEAAFSEYVMNVPDDGCIIVNGADGRAMSACAGSGAKIITFLRGNYEAKDIKFNANGMPEFTVIENGTEAVRFTLGIPGAHNIGNALAAYAVGRQFELPHETIAKSLSAFAGVSRRFQFMGAINGADVYIDYAHHPMEIAATINMCRMLKPKRIICAFQPHTYSRTKALLYGFVQALSLADVNYVLPVYAAREEPIAGVTSDVLVNEMIKQQLLATYSPTFSDAAGYIKKAACERDLVLILGAGDIPELAKMLVDKKNNKA